MSIYLCVHVLWLYVLLLFLMVPEEACDLWLWHSLEIFEPRHEKTNKMSVRPAKTQISLGIRPVWSESSLSPWTCREILTQTWTETFILPGFHGNLFLELDATANVSHYNIPWEFKPNVISRHELNVFDVFFFFFFCFFLFFFSNHYEYVFRMKWKLNIQFLSVRSIRRMCSLNVLQMTTLNVKPFMSFDIAYHTRMIYTPTHIKNMFSIFVLKQIKFISKPDAEGLNYINQS